MRLSVASSAAAEKLVNERSTPARTSDVLSQGQAAISDRLSYPNAISLPSVRNLCQRLLKLRIERCLEVRIQVYEDFVRCRRRRVSRREMRCAQANQVGPMDSVDGVAASYIAAAWWQSRGWGGWLPAVRQGCE